MYLHVGNNMNIRISDIIGIFDTDNATRSALTKKFLRKAELRGSVDSAAEKIPKSFILYRTRTGPAVCFSPLSVPSLVRRIKTNKSQGRRPTQKQRTRKKQREQQNDEQSKNYSRGG